jgi:hypothetical protein
MAEPPPYSPLALIGVLVIVLLGFAAFFISFLIMPLLALAVFYISLASKERMKKDKPPAGASENAQAEASARAVLLRREEEARERQAKREAATRARERTLEGETAPLAERGAPAPMDEQAPAPSERDSQAPVAERGAQADSTPTGG